jgi:hypothetical protein
MLPGFFGGIGSIAPQGRLTARIDDDRRIEFNAADDRQLDHDYAVTSHSAQVLTASVCCSLTIRAFP